MVVLEEGLVAAGICEPILENHTFWHVGKISFNSYNEALSGYLPCVKNL